MSNDSFDGNELQDIRNLLDTMLQRIARLEQHAGLEFEPEDSRESRVDPASRASTVQAVSAILADREVSEAARHEVSEPELVDAEIVDAEIVFAELRDQATATAKTSESRIPNQIKPAAVVPGESLESLIGGRVFTWVGGVLLILAMAFFVVWSWRNLNFPGWVRVALMHSLGLGVILAGNRFKDRLLETHSRVLYGVGIFGLYASALAMTHLYELGGDMREVYGFIDGILITALAIGLSLRNKSVGIILLGALGGYITPLVTLHGSGDEVVVFTYLALLNIGLVVSAQIGRWDFLKPLAWTITALIFLFSLFAGYFGSPQVATAMITLHFIVFLAVNSIPQIARKTSSSNTGNAVLALNSLGFLAGYGFIHEFQISHLIFISWILAAIHAVITWFGFARLPIADRFSRVNLAFVCLFITLALTFAFNESRGYWTTVWAIEGLVFALIGFAFFDRQMLATASIAFGLTLARSIFVDFDSEIAVNSALDPRAIKWCFFAGLISVAGSSYWWIPRVRILANESSPGDTKQIAHPRNFAGALLAVANFVFLTAMYFQFGAELPKLLTICALDIGSLWAVSFFRNQKEMRVYSSTLGVGLAVFACALMASQYSDLATEWNGWSRLAFLASSLVLSAAGWQYWLGRQQFTSESEKPAHAFFTSAGHLLLLGLLTAEIRLYFAEGNGYQALTAMTICTVVWSVYAGGLIAAGSRWRCPTLRILGIVVFGLTAALAATQVAKQTSNLAEYWDGWSRISYLLTAIMFIGAGLGFWIRRLSIDVEIEKPAHGFLTITGHLLMIVVLSAEIAIFYGPAEAARTTSELATYSVVWGGYAALLVALGILLRYPLPRFLGIGLFSIVLIKVFLVDLSQVELIIRVVALLILGLLLLGISLLYQRFRTRIEPVR